MKPVQVPLMRLWLLAFAISGGVWCVLWPFAMVVLAHEPLLEALAWGIGGGVVIGIFGGFLAVLASLPSKTKVKGDLQTLSPYFRGAAEKMGFTLASSGQGELVFQRIRAIAGVRTTLAVTQISEGKIRISGPEADVRRMSWLVFTPSVEAARRAKETR